MAACLSDALPRPRAALQSIHRSIQGRWSLFFAGGASEFEIYAGSPSLSLRAREARRLSAYQLHGGRVLLLPQVLAAPRVGWQLAGSRLGPVQSPRNRNRELRPRSPDGAGPSRPAWNRPTTESPNPSYLIWVLLTSLAPSSRQFTYHSASSAHPLTALHTLPDHGHPDA